MIDLAVRIEPDAAQLAGFNLPETIEPRIPRRKRLEFWPRSFWEFF